MVLGHADLTDEVTRWEEGEDESPDLAVEDIEKTNKIRREHYYCYYCEMLYPLANGPQCPKCKGLDLSGRKHGGDGRKLPPEEMEAGE